MARNGPLARALARTRAASPREAGDPARELRRAIARAAARRGEPEAVQIAAQPLMHVDYARWRKQKLGQGAIFPAPDLGRGRYALVLLAIDLNSSADFAHHGAGGLLTEPTVDTFELETEPAVALTGMLVRWLELYPGPVALAPPLLQISGRWRLADLELDWELESNAR